MAEEGGGTLTSRSSSVDRNVLTVRDGFSLSPGGRSRDRLLGSGRQSESHAAQHTQGSDGVLPRQCAPGHLYQLFLFLLVCYLTQDNVSLLATVSEPSTPVPERTGPSRQAARVCGGGRPLGRWGSGESEMDWPEAGMGTGNPALERRHRVRLGVSNGCSGSQW